MRILSCIFVCAHVAFAITPSWTNATLNEALRPKQTIPTNAYGMISKLAKSPDRGLHHPSHTPQAVTPALLNAGLADAAIPTSSSGSENLGLRYV